MPGYSPNTDGGRGPGPDRPDDAEAINEGGRGEKDRIKLRLDRRNPSIEGVKKKIAHLQRGACDLKILLHFAADSVSAPIVVSVSGDLMKALEVGVGRHHPGKRFLDDVFGIRRLATNMRLWRRGCYDSIVDGTNQYMMKCDMKARELGRIVTDLGKPRTMMFAVIRDTDSHVEQMDENVSDARWRSWYRSCSSWAPTRR